MTVMKELQIKNSITSQVVEGTSFLYQQVLGVKRKLFCSFDECTIILWDFRAVP